VALDEIDIRRDVVERLDRVSIEYYVTGSEAMALHGIAYRQTNDTDFVLAIQPRDYETRLRPAFEPTYVVNALVAHPPRWLGSAIHMRAVAKADFVIRSGGVWADAAFERRMRIDDLLMGPVWVSTLEDLLLAKLEWSEGLLSGHQGNDARAIAGASATLDTDYLRHHSATLGLDALLEHVLSGDA
jgi:hypothetical protein